jgi:hypothetical protein
MAITALPTAPTRADPANFSTRGDAFLTALPVFVTEANALQADVNAKQVTASSAATTATTQANLATTQANLATTQANLATTNGAAQVTLATTQANLASSSAVYKGLWTALTGALNMPASVYHIGSFWALNANLANVTTATPSVSASWTQIKTTTTYYAYDSRASVRSLSPNAGDYCQIESLGLFRWVSGSTEPDDDETAFVTSLGVWELVAADPDMVFSAWLVDFDTLQSAVDDNAAIVTTNAAIVTANAAKNLFGSFNMSLISLATITSSLFTATVLGAVPGDNVIVTPGNTFGTSAADQGRLSFTAYVSAADTVTITIRNASAAVATMVASMWSILVIKQ